MISEAYREMQRELHKNPNYGVASVGMAPLVAAVLEMYGIGELLDYGAGKQRLKATLDQLGVEVAYRAYDPAVDSISAAPEPAECVACIDVLEHIEPDMLDAVLDDLKRLARRYVFLTVHTGPAIKFLPDGRNAHLIQQPAAWWLPKLDARFKRLQTAEAGQGFVYVGAAL